MGIELLLERSLLDSVEIPTRSTFVPDEPEMLRFPKRVDAVRYEWVGRVLHVDFGIVSPASATRALVRPNLALWLSDETVVGLTADFSASR